MAPDKTNVLAVRVVKATNLGEAKDNLSSPEKASERPESCKEGQNSENAQEKRGASPPAEPESKQEKGDHSQLRKKARERRASCPLLRKQKKAGLHSLGVKSRKGLSSHEEASGPDLTRGNRQGTPCGWSRAKACPHMRKQVGLT